MHITKFSERALTPETGLLLGNGDLSVSVYQTANRIIWRFGKNDVWDRRFDFSDDPQPAHIRELACGIRDEGWKCPPFGDGTVEAVRGTKDPKRMKELCAGAPPSHMNRPFPCPKPVGELAMQLPPDQRDFRIAQQLLIEESRIRVDCTWASGVHVGIDCFVAPSPNVLILRWTLDGWNDETHTGSGLDHHGRRISPPLWFSLYRWADPSIQKYGEQYYGEHRHPAFLVYADPKVDPLPPPSVRREHGTPFIEQMFPPDPVFPDGFRYTMVPFAPDSHIEEIDMPASREAHLHLLPNHEKKAGSIAVAVTTSSDPGGPGRERTRVLDILSSDPNGTIGAWEDENKQSAQQFWSRSSLRVSDPLFENLWYETLHARRCTYRRDVDPPGLFLPSTLRDFSHWHGDYHTNYNVQIPFWGDYTANQIDLGDSYFQAMKYFVPIGREIATKYYDCRGVFIQLSGFPVRPEMDPIGVAPMGRMAYMTGWAANQYWWRFQYTRDVEWLRAEGYPMIRDCALFYTDFMQKGEDGFYHAYPSNDGENGFSGDPADVTDRIQVMTHLRYCLRSAILASEALDCDEDLRAAWRERLDHCAGDDGKPPLKLKGIEKLCHEATAPEFGPGRPYRAECTPRPPRRTAYTGWNFGEFPWNDTHWYFGQYPWSIMRGLRYGDFVVERDFLHFRRTIEKWRLPNGLIDAMSIATYGYTGAWTESFGVLAPLQEMMLQSWDGALRIFPSWPNDTAARFDRFRAEGAFLVSASWSEGRVTELEIFSEMGHPCFVYPPWADGYTVQEEHGTGVALISDAHGRNGFMTRAGTTYRIRDAGLP